MVPNRAKRDICNHQNEPSIGMNNSGLNLKGKCITFQIETSIQLILTVADINQEVTQQRL